MHFLEVPSRGCWETQQLLPAIIQCCSSKCANGFHTLKDYKEQLRVGSCRGHCVKVWRPVTLEWRTDLHSPAHCSTSHFISQSQVQPWGWALTRQMCGRTQGMAPRSLATWHQAQWRTESPLHSTGSYWVFVDKQRGLCHSPRYAAHSCTPHKSLPAIFY